MGTTHFLLPDGLTPEATRDLERACMTGGPDNLPWPTQVHLEGNQLALSRHNLDESGCLVAPWAIAGAGRFMGTSATLMERAAPYDLQIELARGKVNQLRCQSWEWQAIGLPLSPALQQQLHDASSAFGRAVTLPRSEDAERQTQAALMLAYMAAEQLVLRYIEQLYLVRHQRQPAFDTGLGCSIGAGVLDGHGAQEFTQACNRVVLPFDWHSIEATEKNYQWDVPDALLAWAEERNLPVCGGPLVDFSAAKLPAWLWLWEQDVKSISNFMCEFVTAALQRYGSKIRSWQLTTASNIAQLLQLQEEDLLYLTLKIAEAAKRFDPSLELSIGIAQPWGEYLAQKEHTRSPFLFADELIRAGLQLAALDLEVIMGVSPRGSYCRDLLDTSRMLDMYALLGVPIQVTLGYPSTNSLDVDADPELRIAGGHWHDGFSNAAQADWATAFAALTIAKPYVRNITWCHLNDAEPHQFPHAGLIDATGVPKPIAQRLHSLREKHLR
jgi:hypothetical protein